jgi:hypothetical protein
VVTDLAQRSLTFIQYVNNARPECGPWRKVWCVKVRMAAMSIIKMMVFPCLLSVCSIITSFDFSCSVILFLRLQSSINKARFIRKNEILSLDFCVLCCCVQFYWKTLGVNCPFCKHSIILVYVSDLPSMYSVQTAV